MSYSAAVSSSPHPQHHNRRTMESPRPNLSSVRVEAPEFDVRDRSSTLQAECQCRLQRQRSVCGSNTCSPRIRNDCNVHICCQSVKSEVPKTSSPISGQCFGWQSKLSKHGPEQLNFQSKSCHTLEAFNPQNLYTGHAGRRRGAEAAAGTPGSPHAAARLWAVEGTFEII